MAFRQKSSVVAPRKSEYSTIIGEGTQIEGKFSFAGAVMLNGRVHGEIVSSDTLIVGDKGVVNATIRGRSVQIAGEVVGNVTASERLQLCATSHVYGDVDAPVVVIEDGAVFDGHCRMRKPRVSDGVLPSAREAAVVPIKR